MGYEYTRANITSVKIAYRCSFYRNPKNCPGMLVFHAATMSYDLANMVPHTCQTGGDVERENALANDDSVCVSVEDDMKKFVDHLIEQNLLATEIWTRTFTKFYLQSTSVGRGLSRSQVQARVHNAKAGSNLLALLEAPDMARVKNALVVFFNLTMLGMMIAGLSKESLRSKDWSGGHTPSFAIYYAMMALIYLWMIYPFLFFSLATNKTQGLYTKMFQCIAFALGKKPNPASVVCDLEAAMIFAIRNIFRLRVSRKMKEYRLSEAEASVAMEFGVLDMLTVIAPEKIAIEGVAWAKSKIKAQCETKGLCYSRGKWIKFWQYFARTWLEMYPPELRNICGVQRKIVNRTNNPLERFHRELNARIKPHPSVKQFVRVIERIAFEYVVHRKSIIKLDGTLSPSPPTSFPSAQPMPNPSEILDADSDNDTAEVLDNLDVPVDENEEPINVAEEALNQPIPTNDWWGNLIHVTDLKNVSNYAVGTLSITVIKHFYFGKAATMYLSSKNSLTTEFTLSENVEKAVDFIFTCWYEIKDPIKAGLSPSMSMFIAKSYISAQKPTKYTLVASGFGNDSQLLATMSRFRRESDGDAVMTVPQPIYEVVLPPKLDARDQVSLIKWKRARTQYEETSDVNGREKITIQSCVGSVQSEVIQREELNCEEKLKDLRDSLAELHADIADGKKRRRLRQQAAKRGKACTFSVGDYVLWSRADPRMTGRKLMVRWVGPFRIAEELPTSFLIEHLLTGEKFDVHEELKLHIDLQGLKLGVREITNARYNSQAREWQVLKSEDSWESLASIYSAVPDKVEQYHKRLHNNNGWISDDGLNLSETAEAFNHFTWQKTFGQLMVVDLQ
ncbi:LOW QUALITY PROTEIN: Hypothetical protein PHPALM_1901, partial [Phytophthora palmivora]